MRLPTLIAVLVAAGVAFWAILSSGSSSKPDPCGPVAETPQQSGLRAAGQTTLCLLNRERTTRGLAPLRENSTLTQTSLQHSQDMVQRDYFEHTDPSGNTVGDRLRAAGYQRGFTVSAGENIAWGVGDAATPAAIVKLWMHSPPHRADILRRSFTDIGIGIALGAPEVSADKQARAATYTTDFGGVFDPSLPTG